MKANIICAKSDLGLTIDGCDLGPTLIYKKLNKNNIYKCIEINKDNIIKSLDSNDLKKNLKEVNNFNEKLYKAVINTFKDNAFPITIGGDHSIAIGSALASKKINGDIGIIWIDAHLDYNTFETTITGNLHGLPLAALNNLCHDLTKFHNGKFFDPKKTVVIGYRSMEENRIQELNNAKKMGVTVFTNDDIKKFGIKNILDKAFQIAKGENGIHISYDLDIIDHMYAPGVSVPELDGIDLDMSYFISDYICKNINIIRSFDLVEYNPIFDKNYITLNIAENIINNLLKMI